MQEQPVNIDGEVKKMPDDAKPNIFLSYREIIEIKGVRFRVKSFGNKVLLLEIVDNVKMMKRK